MARAASSTSAGPRPIGRKPARPNTASAKPPAAKKLIAVKKPAAAKQPPAPPVVSKGELRAQIEALERANATLRAKSRQAGRSAKADAARIAELEQQVAQLEARAAPSAAKPRRRRSPGVDPGDAVPPGVAVETPEPLDGEAEAALQNLEQHLGEE